MEFPEVLTELSAEQLTELDTQVRAEFATARDAAAATTTEESVATAEGLAAQIDLVIAEQERRSELAARSASLSARFQSEPAEESEEAEVAEEGAAADEDAGADTAEEESTDDAADGADDDNQGGDDAPSVTAGATVVNIPRPKRPANTAGLLSITAASDVPGYSTGSALEGMAAMGDALVNRMRGFQPPRGDGTFEDLRHYGVASIRRPFPQDLQVNGGSDDMAVLAHAAQESRLEGSSLVASGGWCSPSEILYDLCETETADGILSIPEVQVNRGGIKYTMGPDFASIYSNVGFSQTEAQAISGTTKTCYEVPCPSFVEIRLDVVGLCIKAPILTNTAYPELVQRWLRGALVAQQHKVNAKVIAAIQTALGSARTMTDTGATGYSTFDAVEFAIEQEREKRALALNATMEVVAPTWLLGALRADMSKRTGMPIQAVTDAQIQAEFAVRHAVVQFVRDWQALDPAASTVTYPDTVDLLIYPAGSFVKGTSDVINLNAVYDAASLVTNIYTALFFEEGVLTAQMCPGGSRVTIAVCSSGNTGAANIDLCGS